MIAPVIFFNSGSRHFEGLLHQHLQLQTCSLSTSTKSRSSSFSVRGFFADSSVKANTSKSMPHFVNSDIFSVKSMQVRSQNNARHQNNTRPGGSTRGKGKSFTTAIETTLCQLLISLGLLSLRGRYNKRAVRDRLSVTKIALRFFFTFGRHQKAHLRGNA